MSCRVLLGALFVLSAGVTGAQPVLLDFEGGIPPAVRLYGSSPTGDPSEVINGKVSLKADFTREPGEWHEFLHTTEHLPLRPNKIYAITFNYRVLDPGRSKTRFYCLAKSRNGGDLQANPRLFTRERGALSHIHQVFSIPGKSDYFFALGVRHQGSIVVDDIRIREVKPKTYAKPPEIRTFPTKVTRLAAQLDALRKKQKLNDLLSDMLVIVCGEGAHRKARAAREKLMRDLRPDFVDWSPIGPLAKTYGIRSSGGGIEYQQYYKKEVEPVWNDRFQRFLNTGFAISLSNMILQDETWGEGGYFMCHNGGKWHNLFVQKLREKSSDRLAICQNNISCSVFDCAKAGFCAACQAKFLHHLATRYPSQDLAGWGIEDLSSFSMQEYALENGLFGEDAWRDPMVREFIKFQHRSSLLNWGDVVRQAKEHGNSQGRAIPVYGNQINADGRWPFAVEISQLCDLVQIEMILEVKDKIPRKSLTYRMGLAGSHHERPVWTRGPVSDGTRQKMPMLSPSFWVVHLGEALANGGIRDFSLGINLPWTEESNTIDYVDDPKVMAVYRWYADMVWENRSLFGRRESAAEVALVYSIPNIMFRRFGPLEIWDGGESEEYRNMARFLEDSHVPFDMLVFGHPETWDDKKTLARLNRYKAIILPKIESLSQPQADALRAYVSAGGNIIYAGRAGTYDENMNVRARPALEGVRMTHSRDRRGVDQILRNANPVGTQFPAGVTVNVWRSREGETIAVHLVSYDVPVRATKIPPILRLPVRLRLPSDLQPDSCLVVAPGRPSKRVSFEKKGDWVHAVLPELAGYAVIAFTRSADYDNANRTAVARRERDKEYVRDLARKQGLY